MQLTLSDRVVDLTRFEVQGPAPDQSVPLTPREASLLAYLFEHADRPVGRDELLQQVWSYHPSTVTRAVDKTVHRLRRKLERDPADPVHLQSVRGFGYRLVARRVEPQAGTGTPPAERQAPTSREGAAAAVRAALEARISVELLGTAGIGKSHLIDSLLVDGSLGGTYPGGVLRPDLAGGTPLLTALGKVLGLGRSAAAPSLVRATLTRRAPTLVVLDPVQAGARETLRGLVEGSPHTWLLSSREALDATPTRVRLEPLATEAASRVLQERVRVLLGGRLPAELHARCDSVAGQVQGIPALLRVIAGRLVRYPGTSLQGGLLDRDPLGSALAASVGALDEGLRRTLTACVPWTGPFDTRDVHALVGGSATPVEAHLEDLLDLSLIRSVTTAGGTRRWVLYDTVRDTVMGGLAPARHARLLERQAAWLEGWGTDAHLEGYHGIGGDERRDRLSGAVQDLRACLARALDERTWERAARLWLALRPAAIDEGEAVVPLARRILDDASSRLSPALRLRLVFGIGSHLKMAGDLEQAAVWLHEALDRAEAGEEAALRGRVLGSLSDLEIQRGRLVLARAFAERSLAVLERAGATRWWAMRMATKAQLLRQEGHFTEAQDAYEQSVRHLRAAGDEDSALLVVANLGNLYRERGQYRQARTAYETAREVAVRRRVHGTAAYLDIRLARVAARLDQAREARTHLERAEQWLAITHHPNYGCDAALIRAELHAGCGEPEQAVEVLSRGLALAEQQRRAPVLAMALLTATRIYLQFHDHPSARTALTRAEELASASRLPVHVAQARAYAGLLQLDEGDRQRAVQSLHEAHALMECMSLTPDSLVGRAVLALRSALAGTGLGPDHGRAPAR